MPIFAVDIETQTHTKPAYPKLVHQIKKFGLTVLAPITDIVFFEKDKEPEIFDMRDWDVWFPDRRGDENKWQRIRDRLKRSDNLIIGHNVIFDLRHIIAHHNFWYPDHPLYLPVGCKVWDTMVIAQRMLLGEQRSDRSPFSDSFALAGGRDKKGKVYIGMAERCGLLEPETPFWEFYTWMKTQRDNLSNLDQVIATLDETHAVWDFLGGYTPPNRPDLLQKAADKLRTEYVVRDAILTYELYEFELGVAKHLAEDNWQRGHLLLPKYPELTKRDILPEFANHLDYWTRRLRLNANRAGRGLKVNLDYVQQQIDKASEVVRTRRKEILSKPDKHDPYPTFERIFSMVMYYKMILDYLRIGSTLSDPSLWAFWKPIQISADVLDDALSDVPGKKQWIEWLLNFEHTSKPKIKASAPSAVVPEIDLEDWVRRNCYIGYDEPLASFLAGVKCTWLRHYYRQPRATLIRSALAYWEEHPDKQPAADEDQEAAAFVRGVKLFKQNTINSRLWTPYYIYCVANAPLPTSDDIKFIDELTTKKFNKEVATYRRIHDAEPEDFQKLAIKTGTMSYGKKAVAHFMSSDQYDLPDLQPLRELMQARADLQKFKEFYVHAQLDGCVHSIIINDTKSGRCSSNNPNLQNIKMATKPGEAPTPFPGTFMAPEGMWLQELDYSNAEVRMGNMIAADDAGAAAAEGHDFHSAMAEIYAGKTVWETYDAATKKMWRGEYKKVTFGGGYGAGDYRLSLMLKTTMEKVQEITRNKKRAFWKAEEQKKIVSDNARKRLAAGCVPVFATLWSKERGQVDRVKYGSKIDCVAYTAWNTMQQGGVTAMISRADVLISEMLEREGYKTFVQQDVHDALIIAFDIEEYMANNRELPRRICEIMGNIMPEEYCERTTPKTHFVTNIGPENKKKWGYHPTLPYPFPTDEFINQWGVFPILPEHKEEAPTWIGPEHEGWTLAQETQLITERKKLMAALDGTDGVVGAIEIDSAKKWVDLQMLLASLPEQDEFTLRLQTPMALVYKDKHDKLVHAGHFPFAAWMAAGERLYHNGNGKLYQDMLCKLEQVFEQHSEYFNEWRIKYATQAL